MSLPKLTKEMALDLISRVDPSKVRIFSFRQHLLAITEDLSKMGFQINHAQMVYSEALLGVSHHIFELDKETFDILKLVSKL